MSSSQAAAGGSGGWRPPFTASQWQELEHQTLIFKYIVAGVPVPPELLFPIFKSFESMTARFYHHPDMGYFSLYGKKPDMEPWRCRRTDGKKWRCSKNAYPDSKYCERHMNRGRNRSRKPVELQSLSQSQPPTSSPSSTVTTLAPSRSSICGTGSSSTRNFPSSAPLNSLGTGFGNYATQMSLSGAILGQLHIGSGYCQTGSEDNSYLSGTKFTTDEHNFLSEAPGSARALSIDSSVDGGWQLIPPQFSAYSVSKPINDSHIQSSPLLQPTQYFDLESCSSLPKQKQHCFFSDEFDSKALMKQKGQLLLSSFDEWPNARNSWPDLEDDKSNKTSISTTQLSISTSMTSSDFSTPCSRSPDGDD